MSKENFPALTWRRHQEYLNPCDPQKGAFGKIWQRQKEYEDRAGCPEEKEGPEKINIPIPGGVSDTKEQES